MGGHDKNLQIATKKDCRRRHKTPT